MAKRPPETAADAIAPVRADAPPPGQSTEVSWSFASIEPPFWTAIVLAPIMTAPCIAMGRAWYLANAPTTRRAGVSGVRGSSTVASARM